MKRVLTKRGFAMLQAGTMTMEQLLADPQFSVEQTAEMVVTQMNLNAPVAAEPVAPVVDLSAATAELKTAQDALNLSNVNLIAANDQLALATAEIAQLKATVTTLEANAKSSRPLMESAVNGLQMRLKGGTSQLSATSDTELVSMFSSLSTKFTELFPSGQVSVVDLKDEERMTGTVMVSAPAVSVFHRANRVKVIG